LVFLVLSALILIKNVLPVALRVSHPISGQEMIV